MTIASAIRGTAFRAAARAGGGNTVVIRRSGVGLTAATTGQPVTTLAVDGTVALGESSLDLDAASLRGSIGQGWKFTIPGHTAAYEVQADVATSANALSGVSISPVLSHEATNDAVVTITQAYGEWTYPCFRREFDRENVDGDTIQATDYMLVVALPPDAFTDIQHDIDRVTFDGDSRAIVRVIPIEPGSDPAVLRLHCRGN